MTIRIKRIYDPPTKNDGQRILVDRLWPRGISKDAAQIDLWLKDIAPSTELRHWFGHEPAKWQEFKHRYFHELLHQKEAVNELKKQAESGNLTLLFAAKDTAHNNAAALKEFLEKA